MKLAIVGYRNYTDYKEFRQYMREYVKEQKYKITEVVSGGCKGTDTLAKKYAVDKKIKYTEFPAKWIVSGKYNSGAGLIRNQQIVEYADQVIAFVSKQSKGTYHTINLTKKSKKPLKIIQVD